VEQGRGDRVPVLTLARIAGALEARVFVRLEWQAEQLDRLIDARHAALVDLVVRVLSSHHWVCATEVTFNVYGERGSVDVLAFHPATGVVLVVEVKSAIPEIGGMLMALDRKVRIAPRIVGDRGWKPTATCRLLVVADGRTTRRRLSTHQALFEAAFPVRGWATRRWLARPSAEARWSGLWIPSGDHQVVDTRRERVRLRAPLRGRVRPTPAFDHSRSE
jgi:hypothetical protein